MGYFSTIKRDTILIHIITWIDLKDIMVSDKGQVQQSKTCVIPFIQNFGKGKIIVNKSGHW